MITSFVFPENLVLQSIVFLISSSILIIATKPLVNKYISKKSIPTNAYSVIGKTGKLIKTISCETPGLVKVDSESWSAISENNVTIPENTEVKILKIDGVKLVVSPKN